MAKNVGAKLSLSYFMNEVPKEQTYPAPERFVDDNGDRIDLVFRILSRTEIKEIRSNHRTRTYVKDSKGRPMFHADGSVAFDEQYDGEAAMKEMLVESLVYPDLKSAELRQFYDVLDNTDLLDKIFTFEEYNYVVRAFNIVHGVMKEEPENGTDKEDNSDISKAKN